MTKLALVILLLSMTALTWSPMVRAQTTDVDDPDETSVSSSPVVEAASPQPVASPTSAGFDCPEDSVTFELITGYVYSAPADMLDSQPGTLMLTDCIDTCRRNQSCRAINYETGLCVLFSSNADVMPSALSSSQFPVFTLYVQKNCLRVTPSADPVESVTDSRGALRLNPRPEAARKPSSRAEPVGAATLCDRSWSFERVQGYELETTAKRRRRVGSRLACQELCLGERDFTCRSANFNNATGECRLSDMDRHTMSGTGAFKASASGSEYLENNCVDDPVKLCEFQKLDGRILKTVDSVFQDVASIDDCRQLCLSAPYRCHAFDYGDTGENVCRLSHHSIATLTHIQEPFLEIAGASTYELSSCYNVTIDCRSGDMVAKIKTSKIFNGKIYAKGSPSSCVNDITASLEFELRMAYNDIDCNVRKDGLGRYSNDIVLQHHDRIVTSADLGLSVHCQYDLGNKSVSNQVDLEIKGDILPVLTEEAVVDSPNVIMRVTSKDGADLKSAQVGDSLDLRFEIVDKNSPFEIFVRDLVAFDAGGANEILLVDSRGCPTDHAIMGPLDKTLESPKILVSGFDAFKFPSSDVVQFRALVTPCLPTCEPVRCEILDYAGDIRNVDSYGRRKRRDTEREELLVVQTIQIIDKFNAAKETEEEHESPNYYSILTDAPRNATQREVFIREDLSGSCANTIGLIIAGALFLAAQLVIIIACTYIWQRRRSSKGQDDFNNMAEVAMSSMHQLYGNNYQRRL